MDTVKKPVVKLEQWRIEGEMVIGRPINHPNTVADAVMKGAGIEAKIAVRALVKAGLLVT